MASNDSGVVGVLATDDYTPPFVTAPQLFTPEDNATGLEGGIEFTWEDTGADSYVLQVASSQDFSDLFLEQETGSTSSIYSDFESGEEYSWRVRANKDGEESAWSQVRSFTILPALAETPELEYPSNVAAGLSVELVLDWADVDGAESYDLQVSVASDFRDPVVDESDLTAMEFDLDGLSNGTEYFWRVRSVNAAGDGDWASAGFTTIVSIAGSPSLEYPSDGAAGLPVELVLDWTEVDGTES